MSSPRKTPRKFSTRPFTAALLLLFALAASVYISNVALNIHGRHGSVAQPLASRDLGVLSNKNRECRQVHHAKDKCKFVRKYCADENAGLIPYLTLYYCDLGQVQPLAFVVLVAWTGMLFTTIGIAASDFFSVNLSTIASILGLSESLAGVTFLAFGNGSPDVFSTFAAIGSNSSSMAVGELIGAAGFITAVVAGSMALVREFKVSKKTYVRDICFFLVAATSTFVLLFDGNLRHWECASLIGFYLFYVVTVVGWHWYATRRKRRRAQEVASRSNFYGPNEDFEPYRDNDEDEDRTAGSGTQRAEAEDIRTLEEGPRVELADDDDLDDDEHRGVHVAAEMASSMRVMRPRGRRSTTTITPIRPSLVGALEFRSVLSSLQRERNMRLRPINHGHGRSYSTDHIEATAPPVRAAERSQISHPPGLNTPEFQPGSASRDRALSSGDAPRGNSINNLINTAMQSGKGPASLLPPPQGERAGSPSPTQTFMVGGKLAPPPSGSRSPSLGLQIEIPPRTPSRSEESSPTLSPFPAFVESPMPLSPGLPPHVPHSPSAAFPSPSIDPGSGIDTPESPKPVKWWPYSFLPAPHVLSGTLFPTLQGWSNKGMWDRFVSIISVPSIFLLMITLPVVETDSCENESEDFDHSQARSSAPALSAEPRPAAVPETEWQQYRRSTRSYGRESPDDTHRLPVLISIESPDDTRLPVENGANAPPREAGTPKPPSPASESSCAGSDDIAGWNRWLVAVQVVMGPMFVAFVIWANMQDEFENPGKTLARMLLYGWLLSLVLLGFLLIATSAHKRPRFHFLLCFLGFIISIAWISTVAGEVVGVLKAFGVILGISEAILGLTIFAVGNSLGDLVADVTVARLGYPVMALSACFGGPMLNILLGIGLGGLFHHEGLQVEVGGTLIVSAISLLITLTTLLVVVPLNHWVMSRRIGWGLIGLWSVSIIVNLVIELSGAWRDVE